MTPSPKSASSFDLTLLSAVIYGEDLQFLWLPEARSARGPHATGLSGWLGRHDDRRRQGFGVTGNGFPLLSRTPNEKWQTARCSTPESVRFFRNEGRCTGGRGFLARQRACPRLNRNDGRELGANRNFHQRVDLFIPETCRKWYDSRASNHDWRAP
jgi:hypothetical protein